LAYGRAGETCVLSSSSSPSSSFITYRVHHVSLFSAGTDTVAHPYPYPDPLVNASSTFQQRVVQLTSLVAETRRWERNLVIAAAAAARTKRKQPAATTTTAATAYKDS